MLAIKLRRVGKKHQPSFRIVVAEKRSKINGKFVEDLGFVNRIQKQYSINKERALYWLSKGAQPTDVVYNLFVSAGIIEGKKIPVHKNKNRQSTTNQQQEAVIEEVTTNETNEDKNTDAQT